MTSSPPPPPRIPSSSSEMPHPPEKIWRALTEGPLIDEWLMKNDFEPVIGHTSLFARPVAGLERRDRLQSLDGRTHQPLSYSWNASGDEAANGLKTSSPGR